MPDHTPNEKRLNRLDELNRSASGTSSDEELEILRGTMRDVTDSQKPKTMSVDAGPTQKPRPAPGGKLPLEDD